MTTDGGKDLNIEYNYLNLPEVVDFGGDNKLFYHYDAAGNKLVKYKDVSAGTPNGFYGAWSINTEKCLK